MNRTVSLCVCVDVLEGTGVVRLAVHQEQNPPRAHSPEAGIL